VVVRVRFECYQIVLASGVVPNIHVAGNSAIVMVGLAGNRVELLGVHGIRFGKGSGGKGCYIVVSLYCSQGEYILVVDSVFFIS